MKVIEKIISDLSRIERDILIEKINNSELFEFVSFHAFGPNGFVKTSIGWIHVKEPKESHPNFSDSPLPVGFISESKECYCGELVNTDIDYFKNYHDKLREIYLEFKK